MASIDTAVPLLENNDLEQPLIPNTTEEEYARWHIIDLGESDDEENDDERKTSTRTSTAFSCWGQRLLTSWQFLNGFWLGFVIQTISLGSTAIIAINWGTAGAAAAGTESSPGSWIASKNTNDLFYVIFFLLSQSWWLLFPVICIAIDGGLTGSRGQGILEKYFVSSNNVSSYSNSSSNTASSSQASPRELFLGGVRFHVGIVFGCFVVWSMIDLYFDASIGVFAALFASLLACLGLCYAMVVIHDRFITSDNDDEQQQQTNLLILS